MEGFSQLALYGGIYCGVCLFWVWLSVHYRERLVSMIGTFGYRAVIVTHFVASVFVGGVVVHVLLNQPDMKLLELIQFGGVIIVSSAGLAYGWRTVEQLLKG